MKKIKIAVVVASRANYGRVKSLMRAIKEHERLELLLIVGASAVINRYGATDEAIKKDGFNIFAKCHYLVEGENLSAQAKTTGLGIIEISSLLEFHKPDAVVTVADRYETMSTAISASYLNIPLIHIQGGEISGNIDDKVRHAITQLSDWHFPATEMSKERIISMGVESSRVFNFGCPAMDLVDRENLKINIEFNEIYKGIGSPIDWSAPYCLVIQHPVTTNFGKSGLEMEHTLSAVSALNMQTVIVWPNPDAGSNQTSKKIREFREKNSDSNIKYIRAFHPDDYVKVLANAKILVGNSSSFIREGSFLGTRAVIIGNRQTGREVGSNVLNADYDPNDILSKINLGLSLPRPEPSNLFGEGNAGIQIAQKISELI